PDPDRFFAFALADFEKSPELVALTVYLRVFPESETASDKVVGWMRNFAVRVRNNFFRKGDCAGGEFQMIRKEAFWKIGGYREELVTCEDRDLFRRLVKIGKTMPDQKLTDFHAGRRAHTLAWTYLIVCFMDTRINFGIAARSF